MNLQSRHHSVLLIALLIASVIACKSSGSSTSSTTNKTEAPKNTNSSTSTTSAPATPPDIAGKYNVVGGNPGGGVYKGTLEIIPHGDVYQFRWDAGTQYDGVGVTNGNVVAVAFANGANGKGCGVVDYEIASDGALRGRWGYWGTDESGTEKATRTLGSGLIGTYDATGANPDGRPYKVQIVVVPLGSGYKFAWSNNTEGFGVRRGDNVAVGIGGARCGFVSYEVKSDGTLDGVWGGYGSDKTGTERATKK